MRVLILHNEPALDPDHPDYASEAGVLEAVGAANDALIGAGHRVDRLGLGDSIQPLFDHADDGRAPEVVFNLCEGFGGTARGEPFVAGALEMLRLAYTGSPPECLSLVREKARTKWMLLGAGAPTAEFVLIGRNAALPSAVLERLIRQGPVIIKPAGEDASLGITGDSVVDDLPKLIAKIQSVRNRYGDVLAERYIAGREFNVGVVALPEPHVLPLAEIEFEPDPTCRWPIVTYDAKWTADSPGYQTTPVACPADVEHELAERIQQAALIAYRLTGCRDYARIDVRVSDAGEVFVLEVNANPDLSPSAGLARQINASGMDYDAFIVQLAETARKRGLPPGPADRREKSETRQPPG